MKRLLLLCLTLLLALSCALCAAEEPPADRPVGPAGERGERPDGAQRGEFGGNRGGGGSVDKSADETLQAMIAEVAPKFQLLTFADEETGAQLQYQLFIPEGYDASQRYPLVMFIPDSSAVGRGTDIVLSQGWGGLIWAAPQEQARHPSFVLVPVFTETVVDDSFNHSAQIDVAVRLIESLLKTYSIDESRLYTTGQSMGGMTSFYLNIAYPDLFAASLFVGSQWDNSLLSVLEDKSFFYIVSAGDPKASAGQSELLAVFDADGAAYAHGQWSAQASAQEQDDAVKALLAQGQSANFVTFELGTTLPEGTSAGAGGEHMTSFDYAYKLEAVRDWLFAQSKSE